MTSATIAAKTCSSEQEAFLAASLDGLSQSPKRLPGKYLWDEAGSILFDRICDDPDYYPTRCEMALLPRVAQEIAGPIGPGATIVEFGSGASRKIRVLLEALARPARYIAIDISEEYLEASLDRLRPDYPDVAMEAVCADYSQPVRLPMELAGETILGFFPGTSIGNFGPDDARAFLARAKDILGPSHFLIGADTTRDEERLTRAYGECGGLMGAFHLNLLARMNRELDAEIALDGFRHEVKILPDPFRVEAHLVSLRDQTWTLGGKTISFAAGESVRTDTSHKYDPDTFGALAAQAGWHLEQSWIDTFGFGLYLLRAE
ncbi:MAG: L-histidine N(alpha)-methyltransferase [Parafilimonas terrae]|nr:L-histidine N(alpha)-methyltransferase [Parafilimonas terrae]